MPDAAEPSSNQSGLHAELPPAGVMGESGTEQPPDGGAAGSAGQQQQAQPGSGGDSRQRSAGAGGSGGSSAGGARQQATVERAQRASPAARAGSPAAGVGGRRALSAEAKSALALQEEFEVTCLEPDTSRCAPAPATLSRRTCTLRARAPKLPRSRPAHPHPPPAPCVRAAKGPPSRRCCGATSTAVSDCTPPSPCCLPQTRRRSAPGGSRRMWCTGALQGQAALGRAALHPLAERTHRPVRTHVSRVCRSSPAAWPPRLAPRAGRATTCAACGSGPTIQSVKRQWPQC